MEHTAELIRRLRTDARLSPEQLAAALGLPAQTLTQWEEGAAAPTHEQLAALLRCFDLAEQPAGDAPPADDSLLAAEYRQATEEGRDLADLKEVFEAVARLEPGEAKRQLCEVLFAAAAAARRRRGYPYAEPSTLAEIQALRAPAQPLPAPDAAGLAQRVAGAWLGRVCGCLLGKTVEGMRTDELVPFLQCTGNYPMHRYILHSDLNDDILRSFRYPLAQRCYADEVDGMPTDDDTNYTVLAQKVVERCGRAFTSEDVARSWLALQPRDAYFTAERVAFGNLVAGYPPPACAVHKNPYREWIGAQIRGDYFGYINPGAPALAAEMAWRDARISHVKNGIYGEMYVAAMLAAAAVISDREEIIRQGLAQIPCTSRLYEALQAVLAGWRGGVTQEACFADIHARYDEHTDHGWCHTIPNAMIVTAALLYGGGDYGRSICMAVQTGFDTDCNGATVGSVLGMAGTAACIDPCWSAPIGGTLHTSLLETPTVRLEECVATTLRHMA